MTFKLEFIIHTGMQDKYVLIMANLEKTQEAPQAGQPPRRFMKLNSILH